MHMSPDGDITINESQMLRVIGTSTTDRWVVYTPSYALNDTLLFKFSPKDREGSSCISGWQKDRDIKIS